MSSLLDSVFGIQKIYQDGVEAVTRKALDFVGDFAVTDDPVTGRTKISIEVPPGLVWRGPWSADVEYAERDVVNHDGAVWIAASATAVGDEPGVSEKWGVLVELPEAVASDVGNDSSVAGDSVAIALDMLDAAITALADTITSKHFRGTAATFAHAAAVDLDVGANNVHVMSDELTADVAVTLSNGQDGDSGVIWFRQDDTGGWKITGIVSGERTVLMADSTGASLNTAAFLEPEAVSGLTYDFVTVGGVECVMVGMITTSAAGFA